MWLCAHTAALTPPPAAARGGGGDGDGGGEGDGVGVGLSSHIQLMKQFPDHRGFCFPLSLG